MPESKTTNWLARLTERQRLAVGTIDRSVLVSAAAGSGKTTVLAERCAALVCDLPADRRCGVDELLVVTFTDAAAGEMRTRIAAAIRERLAARPDDAYLQEQLYRVDSAAISTIHAFCRSLIQRWFPRVGIDPQFAVLDEDVALLIRQEVLEDLFAGLYEAAEEPGPAFRKLVDDYGAGDDTFLGPVILRMHDFLCSLAEPQAWLDKALRRFDPEDAESLIARLDELQHRRLTAQLEEYIERAGIAAQAIRRAWPVAEAWAVDLDGVAGHLRKQLSRLREGASWEEVAGVLATDWGKFNARQPNKPPEPERRQYQSAKKLRDDYKDGVIENLQKALCQISREDLLEGLRRVGPHVRTLVGLVRAFGRRYGEAKRAQAALDFNDLQRLALNLLCEGGDTHRPSEVARSLQKRFRHVLVDEFQDIDPLQEAILRMVSRESTDPRNGNHFAVGDIKQSIYRFRLAEPRLFAERAEAFARPDSPGVLIHLQENHRSRPEVIEAVNLLFEPLMSRDFGGSNYDEHARLHAGAVYPSSGGEPTFGCPAVELHVVQVPNPNAAAGPPQAAGDAEAAGDGESAEDVDGSENGPDDETLPMEGIEYEGWLIAERILHWIRPQGDAAPMMVADRPACPGDEPRLRPIAFRDIVILLRSMPHKAAPIAAVLQARGIPVLLDRADDSLDSTEFRDLHSLLQVLDNPRQDIPLAAVLRSPLLGEPLSEADLLEIRESRRSGAFHEAVLAYRTKGGNGDLRDRLERMLARLERYRRLARHEPIADVIGRLLAESQYPAFVSGLPGGRQRRERLIRVHDLARTFSRFSRQGLHRFVAFLDQVVEAERPGKPPAPAGENAVRIMTIHASKGLEFPVVILADLTKKFNLADVNADLLLDRQQGIGLRATDPDRRLKYPTLSHHLVGEQMRAEMLAEELRILYVALTRAREHLMLVARVKPSDKKTPWLPNLCAVGPDGRVPRYERLSAGHYLDWVRAALSAAPTGKVRWPLDRDVEGGRPLIEVHLHEEAQTQTWSVPTPAREIGTADRDRPARLEPLPENEPAGDRDAARAVIERCAWQYPHLELTALPARISVSEIKRRWRVQEDPEERTPSTARPQVRWSAPAFLSEAARAEDPTVRGTATHRLLQLLDVSRPGDAGDLRSQLEELVARGAMSRAEAGHVALDDVAWFWQTDLGMMIRRDGWQIRREVPFVSRLRPEQIDPHAVAVDPGDAVLVRGMVDLLLTDGRAVIIVDFKTDRVGQEDVAARSREYESQMDLYARAISEIYRLPVIRRCLVFLHARAVVDLPAD